MSFDAPHRTIETVWRIESAKLIATLTRIVGDVGIAEDLAQDALVSALEKWPETGVRIAVYYGELARLASSPVVELNRAVAVGMAVGPATGLELVDALLEEPSLKTYHLLPAVRGDLLAKLGRVTEAQTEFERAAALTRNTRERAVLLARAAQCAGATVPDESERPDHT